MPVESEKAYELAQTFTKLFVFFKPKRFIKDLKPTEMMVLMSVTFISKDGIVVTPSKICDKLGFSKSSLTAILNSLEEKELIERTLSKDDRRMIFINLTAQSKQLLNSYHNDVNNYLTNLADFLGEEDTEKFIELLKKAHTYISENFV